MKSLRAFLAAFVLSALCVAGASAQSLLPVTVATCGTPPAARSAGLAYQPTQDVNGNLCTIASGGGGGSTTIAGPLGPSTSTANSVSIVPGAGALFVVNAGVNSASSLWGSVNNATSVSGGVASFSRIPSSAATTNLTGVKSSAGRVYKVRGCNTTASPIYMKLYNIASGSVTVGTSTVFDSFAFPANQCASYDYSDMGSFYSTAITYALTGGTADSDATAIGAGAMTQVTVGWQ